MYNKVKLTRVKNAFVGLEQFIFIFERVVLMKMFRKAASIVLVSLMCCCVSIQSAASTSEAAAATSEQALTYEVALNNAAGEFIDEYPNHSELINEKLNTFLQDPELERVYVSSPDDALVIFNRAIEIGIEISSNDGIEPCMSTPVGSGWGTLYYCTVDASIQQEQENWCGPGSISMALSGIETYNRNTLISGYTRPTQSDIAPNVMGGDGAVPGNMTSYLNSMLKANKYTCEPITASTTKNDVKEYIINSLINNRPVILNSLPYNTFSYYSGCGYTGGHYLVVEDYNSYTDTYTVVDCTYLGDENNVYHGRHGQITIDEIYNSVKYVSGEDWRYVIHG